MSGPFFLLTEDLMNFNKTAKTIDEQIQKLKDRNLIIEDEKSAKEILFSINYYNFSGYLFDYRKQDGTYSDVSFEKVYKIYKCDERIKSLLLYAIELIEHNLRTKLSYRIAHLTSPSGYCDSCNFNDIINHKKLMQKFDKAVIRNKNLPFVKHHLIKYNGFFPVWVAVELFSLGMILNCYKNLKTPIRKAIAKDFNTGVNQLSNWIECTSYLRNLSAHYMRLYNFNIQKTPMRCKKNSPNFVNTYKLYDIIYIMRFLIPDKKEWNNYILPGIEHIFTEYNDAISISAYGFPDNWQSDLYIN